MNDVGSTILPPLIFNFLRLKVGKVELLHEYGLPPDNHNHISKHLWYHRNNFNRFYLLKRGGLHIYDVGSTILPPLIR